MNKYQESHVSSQLWMQQISQTQEIGPFGSPDHAESGCNKYEDSVIPWYLWYLQVPPLHLGRQDGISCFCHCTCRLRTGAGMAHWVAHCGTVEASAWCVGLRLRLPAANDPNRGLRRQRDPRPSYQAAVKYSCLVWNLCLVLNQQWCQGDACTTGHRRLSAWNIKQPLACIHLLQKVSAPTILAASLRKL